MTSQAVPSRTIYLVPARTVKAVQRVVPVRNQVQTVHAQSYGQKRPAPTSSNNVDPIEELLGETTNSGVPRKRERLTHLTAEEKLNRRKMKNRVAAQTARDRKKIRSQRLEDVVRDLLRENEQLRIENAELRETVAQNQTETPSTTSCQIATPMTTFGSAEVPGRQRSSQSKQEAASRNARLDSTRAAQSAAPLLQNDELERILQDLQDDFDIDQLASELPFDGEEEPLEDAQPETADLYAHAEVEASTSAMEQNLLTMPDSPEGSSSFGFDAHDMSPRSMSDYSNPNYSNLCLDDSMISQPQKPLLGDPMLGSPTQDHHQQQQQIYSYSLYGWDQQDDVLNSFDQTFYEEFVQTSY